jgi:hypothetical protein
MGRFGPDDIDPGGDTVVAATFSVETDTAAVSVA